MFNKNVVYYGLSGYIIGLGYSVLVEAFTKENKWNRYYEKFYKENPTSPPCCVTPLKPASIVYILPVPSLIGLGIGVYRGYYNN